MPYIPVERRIALIENRVASIGPVDPEQIETPGELNFAITYLLNYYLEGTDRKYADYNAAIGVLECAKLELYRRVISNYEDKKIEENGDVYLQ